MLPLVPPLELPLVLPLVPPLESSLFDGVEDAAKNLGSRPCRSHGGHGGDVAQLYESDAGLERTVQWSLF